MLGFEPDHLQVITAGINHMNFLLDIRKKGSAESYMDEFLETVRKSKYWQQNLKNVPEQVFTLNFLNTFGIYPVGYDNHIAEYIPFFYEPQERKELKYPFYLELLEKVSKAQKKDSATGTIADLELDRMASKDEFSFPKDPASKFYKEAPVSVMEAFITGKPHYFDSMVLLNRGCITNLAPDAAVDIPAIAVGGQVHGINVGELPFFAAELCRRQIAIHELVAQAATSGDHRLFLEALCLGPFVRSLNMAKRIMHDYLEEYREYLPQFFE